MNEATKKLVEEIEARVRTLGTAAWRVDDFYATDDETRGVWEIGANVVLGPWVKDENVRIATERAFSEFMTKAREEAAALCAEVRRLDEERGTERRAWLELFDARERLDRGVAGDPAVDCRIERRRCANAETTLAEFGVRFDGS